MTWWTCFVLLVAAPALEELVFRCGLQEWLHRHPRVLLGPRGAVGFTAAAFCAAHGLCRGWLLALAVGPAAWLLGELYRRRRQALPCIALHAFFNLAWWLATTVASPALPWLACAQA